MIGASLGITDSYRTDAAELEAAGYSSLWIAGGQLSSLSLLADVLRATEKVDVGSGIIPVEVYDAASVAQLYREFADTGRLVVGIGGAQVPRPLRMLNAYLDDLDELGVPRQARMLAALGPRKLELARDRTNGAVPLLVTPEYTATARQTLGPDRRLVVWHPVVLDPDAARARAAVRELLGFLSGVAGYRKHFARIGFSEVDIAELSDHLVDSLSAWGDEAAIAAGVGALLDAGADEVVLTIAPTPHRPDPHTTLLHLADHLPGMH
jgi:probable F420-dependent oxidoreductase